MNTSTIGTLITLVGVVTSEEDDGFTVEIINPVDNTDTLPIGEILNPSFISRPSPSVVTITKNSKLARLAELDLERSILIDEISTIEKGEYQCG